MAKSKREKAFEVKRVYTASNGKRFKCLEVDAARVVLAPLRGCVALVKKSFARSVRINQATKRQCVKVNERGSFVWLTA